MSVHQVFQEGLISLCRCVLVPPPAVAIEVPSQHGVPLKYSFPVCVAFRLLLPLREHPLGIQVGDPNLSALLALSPYRVREAGSAAAPTPSAWVALSAVPPRTS